MVIQRCDSPMSDTEDVSIILWRVGHMVERGNSIVAGELEHMSRVLDDIDVDVAAFEWIHASTSIDRVLVLIYLNDVVKLIWTILISAKVI